jgi:hypothetical protein
VTTDQPADALDRMLDDYDRRHAALLRQARLSDEARSVAALDELFRERVLPVLEDVASRLRERGHMAEVVRKEPVFLDSRRPHLGGIGLMVHPRGSHQAQYLAHEDRHRWPSPTLGFHPHANRRMWVTVSTHRGMSESNWNTEYSLDELTTEVVWTETLRLLEEVLALPEHPAPPRGYLRGRTVESGSAESSGPLRIEAVTADSSSRSGGEGRHSASLTVRLSLDANLERRVLRFLDHSIANHLSRALDVRASPGHREPMTILLTVSEDDLDEVLRVLPLAIVESNENYPEWLAESEAKVAQYDSKLAAERAQAEERSGTTQRRIDDIMSVEAR